MSESPKMAPPPPPGDSECVAQQLQEQGNQFYACGQYDQARSSYTQAIDVLRGSSTPNRPMEAFKPTLSILCANRAQCFIQQRDFANALKDCEQAIHWNRFNEKAHLRRFQSLQNLERLEQVIELAQTLHNNSAELEFFSSSFAQQLRQLVHQSRRILAQDQQVAHREAQQVGKLVHDQQKLRLNFGHVLPQVLQVAKPVEISVYIGNEFGLLNRKLFVARYGRQLTIKCSLRFQGSSSTQAGASDSSFVLKRVDLDATTVARDPFDDNPADALVVELNEHGKATFMVQIDRSHAAVAWDSTTYAQVMISMDDPTSDILPVVSLPFRLDVGQVNEAREGIHESSPMEVMMTQASQLGIHSCRVFAFAQLDQDVLLAEAPGSLGIAGKLWDSSLVLIDFLMRNPHLVHHKRIVELGSGLGLVGLVCGYLGGQVVLTDMDQVVPLLRFNIHMNFGLDDSIVQGPPKAQALAHAWGTQPMNLLTAWTSPDQQPQCHLPDLIVCSDVVYDPEGYAPLVASFVALTRGNGDINHSSSAPDSNDNDPSKHPLPGQCILMAHRSRNPMEYQFFDLLKRHGFVVTRLPTTTTEAASTLTTTRPTNDDANHELLHDVQLMVIASSTVETRCFQ